MATYAEQRNNKNKQSRIDSFTSTPGTDTTSKRKAVSPLSSMKNEKDILDQVQQMINKSVSEMKDQFEIKLNEMSNEIERLTGENATMQIKNQINEGRICRLEKVVSDLQEDLLQTKARAMSDSLVFRNIPETDNETKNCKMVLLDFFRNELLIDDNDMQHIDLQKAHRLGQPGKHNRIIVAKLDDVSKDIIWAHTKNLKGKSFSVQVQLPKELLDRKSKLYPLYKEAKEKKQPVRWLGDKLKIGNDIHQARRDAVQDINMDITEAATQTSVYRSPPTECKGSKFQGAYVEIASTDDIIPSLQAINSDHRCARATHNIYAYRISKPDGFMEHYEDDGEYGAGRKLLDLLISNNINNIMVCVSRWYGGTHIGQVRFEHIMNAAKTVLNI